MKSMVAFSILGVMQYRNKLLDNRDVQFVAVPDN